MKPALPSPPRDDHRNSIGFLRLLLATAVVYVHCFRLGGFGDEWLWIWSHGRIDLGKLAVQSFFVISGVLITRSWINRPDLRRFLWNRFLRLVPALWVCLAVTAFVFTPLLHFTTPEPRTPFFSLMPSAWDYVWHNLVLPRTQLPIGVYPNGGPWAGDWNGSLWTLFYEGACYLMIAGLGLLGLLRRGLRTGGALIIGFVVLYTVWTILHPYGGGLPKRIDRLFDTPGKELTLYFLAGSAWALFPEFGARLLRPRWAGPAVCALLMLGWTLGVHSVALPWLLPPLVFWLATVLPLAGFEKYVGGDYSYGLYIYGYPVQQILAHFNVHTLGFSIYLIASLVAAGLCAVVSWKFVERPMLSLKNRFNQPACA